MSGITQEFRGSNNYRPNVIGDPLRRQELDHRATSARPTSSFPPTRASRSATRSATACSGPWFWQLDFVASKNFKLPIGSQTNLQIRIEAFNLLNRTNFRAPNGNRSSAAFGTITSTYDARQIQLGVKVTF